MLWFIIVIVCLVLFIAFLVFRIHTMKVSLHDTVYGLLNQIVIVRDASYQLIQDSTSDVNTKLRLYSFFSQGDMGDMMGIYGGFNYWLFAHATSFKLQVGAQKASGGDFGISAALQAQLLF